MTKKEARKLCRLIWKKQNMIPPFWLLLKGFHCNTKNIHEWNKEDKL